MSNIHIIGIDLGGGGVGEYMRLPQQWASHKVDFFWEEVGGKGTDLLSSQNY